MSLTARIRILGVSRQDILRQLRNLPAILAGNKNDNQRIGRLFRSTITHHTYTKIFDAFMAKSDGKADEFGEVWEPLSPRTIAQRPISRIEKWKAGVGNNRGLLTQAQDRQWRGIFASTLGRLLKQGTPIHEAKQRAGQVAWAVMKARGAKTKLDVFGRRKVPILRVSDRLVDSLSPGEVVDGEYIPFTPDQVAEFRGNTLRYGTKVPYAKKQHQTRPLWPTPQNMAKWNTEALRKGRDAIVTAISRSQSIPRS